MFTTGTKLLVGAAVLAGIAAALYGVFADGTLGVIGLVSASAGLVLLAGVNAVVRDSDVPAMDPAAVAVSAAARTAPGPSVWPLAVAAGAGLAVVGLVSEPIVFILGVVVMLAAGVEWVVEAWSDGASADEAYNRAARSRLAGPLEFSLLGVIAAVVIVYSFSRIMLFMSKATGPVAFAAVAALLLVFGFLIARRPSIRSGGITVLCVIGGAGIIAGGAAAALEGERDIEAHETTSGLAEHFECATPEETHADENASQRVAATASLHAIVTLGSDGELLARVPGVPRELTSLTIARSTPTNVLFRNETGEPRRLTLDLGERPAVDENGDAIEGETEPNQMCTALVDEGGEQLLTFVVAQPSRFSPTPYQFIIPGVDGVTIQVTVT